MEKLLEEIRKYIGCLYISDLHTSISKKQILELMKSMPEGRYTLEEWSGVCTYIFENKELSSAFKSYEELEKYLS